MASDALRTFWILFDTLMFFWTGKHYAVHNKLRVRWSAHCSTLTISRIGHDLFALPAVRSGTS